MKPVKASFHRKYAARRRRPACLPEHPAPLSCYPALRLSKEQRALRHATLAGQSFLLGRFRVEPARGVIVAEDGAERRLEPQLMDLLLLFAGTPGEVLSKERIIASVWQGRAIGDDTLAAAISRLRTALAPEKLIETIPKRGYRFVIAPDVAWPKRAETSPADDALAQGFAILKAPTPLMLGQAKLYFEAAINREASNARAHAGLAHTLLLQHLMGSEPSHSRVEAAKSAAHAALAHDAHDTLALSVLGFCVLLSERDFAAADTHFQKARASKPASAIAHRYRGVALAAAGRLVEAEREARAGLAADTVSLSAHGELMQILMLARRYGPLLAEAKQVLALAPNARDAWSAKGWAHLLLGEEREARDAFLESLKAWGMDAKALEALSLANERGGMTAMCAAVADLFEAQHVGFIPRTTDIALLRAYAGDADSAFAALNAAAAKDDPYLLWVLALPQLDRLHNDPRFAALRERVRPVR
jgi:DNA-binding winged helix-turn-helix (wHTH) protein